MIGLRELVPDLLDGALDVPALEISSVAIDSRRVSSGALFLALVGADADGHDYIDSAVANGAAAVLAQRAVGSCSVPLLVVEDLAARVSQIAGEFYEHPSRTIQCVAVTGTNGKTSVAHYVAQLAHKLGVRAAFLGTTGWGLVGDTKELETAELTTADAVTLQQRLRTLKDSGAQLVALELSSHALEQHRGAGLFVDVALFTNLSRDHLDYHGSMENYGAAKARLFDFPSLQSAVVNADDAFGAELVRTKRGQSSVSTLALVCEEAGSDVGTLRDVLDGAELRIVDLQSSADGLRWKLHTPWGDADVGTQIIGNYNAVNLSLAIAALASLGYELSAIVAAASAVSAPAGRLQRVFAQQPAAADAQAAQSLVGPAVFVDYAHTPDALVSVLTAVRRHCVGRLICVFGCGGDRDVGKRAPMGQAVCTHADLGFLTSDNPRFEDPLAIIEDVLEGVTADCVMQVQPDRRLAIAAALDAAGDDDVVVIAGKGHETYQDIAGERIDFDDAAIAQELLGARVIVPANASDAIGRGKF